MQANTKSPLPHPVQFTIASLEFAIYPDISMRTDLKSV